MSKTPLKISLETFLDCQLGSLTSLVLRRAQSSRVQPSRTSFSRPVVSCAKTREGLSLANTLPEVVSEPGYEVAMAWSLVFGFLKEGSCFRDRIIYFSFCFVF